MQNYNSDLIYDKQDQVPRSKWTGNPWFFSGYGKDLVSNKDYSKCGSCGGTGRAFIPISAGRKRLSECSDCDC